MSANEIFLFVINPPNEKPITQKLIANHVFECFKIRNKKREGRQKVDQMCVCVCNYHYICNKYTWEFVRYKYVITWKIVALNHLENSWCTRWYEIQIINIVLVLSNKVRGPGACFPRKIRTFWMSGTLVLTFWKAVCVITNAVTAKFEGIFQWPPFKP